MTKLPANKRFEPKKSKIVSSSQESPGFDLLSKLKVILGAFGYQKIYALFGVTVLAGTSLLWAILGAKLQQSNADQLVNSYLFDDSSTIHKATLPAAHSFLIKWPLFYLIKLFNYSSASFISLTVLSVLATVAVLAFVLYKIEHRPLVFGTICLALASALLLVPAQPYAGALLPVNMAMLATRNLEYVTYIASIMLFIRSGGARNRWFWLAVFTLGILVASDKLFLGISVFGAVLGLAIYALRRRWDAVTLSSNWLMASLAGAVFGIAILAIVNATGFSHISSESSGAPYSLISSSRDLVLGILYGGLGILTNFGANPAYDATIVHNIPHRLLAGVLSLSGPAYVINLAILGFVAFGAFYLIKTSLFGEKSTGLIQDKYASLAFILLLSSGAAFALFVSSNHYYAVDARYLSIFVFSLFICSTVWIRSRNWPPKKITAAGMIILAGLSFGIVSAIRAHNSQAGALSDTNQRNSLIANVLGHHKVKVLVGDYWRVIPTRHLSGNKLNVMPLSSCFQPRDTLSSQTWQVDLKKNSFAYLLSLDRSLSDYPRCSLNGVIAKYGRPNTSVLIAGSLSQPKELLLFYDRGAHQSSPKTLLKTPSTILPITPDDLPYAACSVPTVLNIVAHQDDDLLFMSPDLIHEIKAGHCVRTVYVTAGDAGGDQFYWLNRQQGSEAAYSKMLGVDDIWIERIVKLDDHQFITVANPRGNSKVSLIFMRLPDGSPKGEGFAQTHFESLARLQTGKIHQLDSVDRQSTYTSSQLAAALTSLMQLYSPSGIFTQANFISNTVPDHSDHMAVGNYVKQAYANYENQQYEGRVTIPIKFYIGYPIHQLPENVFGDDLQAKMAAFFAYAQFDGGVCRSLEQCAFNPAYNSYLRRQYNNPD